MAPYKNLLGNWKLPGSTRSGGSSSSASSSNESSNNDLASFETQSQSQEPPGPTPSNLALPPSASAPAPSNVSVFSHPSTVSSYQPSLFSRNASTLGSVSTGLSSSRVLPDTIMENDQYDTSGKLMRILNEDEILSMSPPNVQDQYSIQEQQQSIQQQQQQQQQQPQTQRSFPPMSIRIQHTMPEVPMPDSSTGTTRDIHGAISPDRSSIASASSSKLSRYLSRTQSSHTAQPGLVAQSQQSQEVVSVFASTSASSSFTEAVTSGAASIATNTDSTASAVNVLNDLYLDLSAQIGLVLFKGHDLQRVCGSVTNALRFAAGNAAFDSIKQGDLSTKTDLVIPQIIKVVLHLTDSLLIQPQLQPTKMYLLRALYQLGVRLKLVPATSGTVPHPENFAMGANVSPVVLNQIQDLLDQISSQNDSNISEQEGAFIAPILRGFSAEFSVASLIFGFPRLDSSHMDMIVAMFSLSTDIHMCCQKNYIRTCGSGFKAPFRIPEDVSKPPISMSLGIDNASSVSGTLGGYIYPKIDSSDPESASSFESREIFAMTCAHVCLSETTGSTYPKVCVPSPVLIKLYRKALKNEAAKYPEASPEKREYLKAVDQLEVSYPNGNPATSFGQVVWGERTVVNNRISDLAIIKCNNNVNGQQIDNYLGNDVAFSEYDPALMFGNLYIRRIVHKLMPGMKVFKYASTTKYTSGQVNGPRMVYWADGKIQSSEFVVRSETPMFASGGDSGAWVLQKFEESVSFAGSATDRDTITSGSESSPSLGVVGMLHSYDGERKEFGLFTPIDTILERLHEVTNINWGIVGVPEDYSNVTPAGGSESDASESDSQSDKSA